MTGIVHLLKTRRFLPLFLTQALGAINDNLFKNALVVLILFKVAEGGPVLVALSSGVFILPYGLFSAVAGQVADKWRKSAMIRWTKAMEVGVMLLAAAGFMTANVPALMAVLFALGTQAALFSPLKYGVIPELLAEDELVAGNGLVEAGTFLGILVGTIAGGSLIAGASGPAVVSLVGVGVAVAGLLTAAAIPPVPTAAPDLAVDWNPWRQTAALVRQARASRPVWLSILGLSWFWTVGAVLLAEFPVVAKQVLSSDEAVVTALLAVFAVGIGVGSVACARLLRGEVSARHVPFAAIGISAFALDFAMACPGAVGLDSVGALLSSPGGWRLLSDLFLLAACGGVYSVPLYAIIQEESAPDCRSRMIACNNVMNAAFMALGAVASAAMAAVGASAPSILAAAALANLAVAVHIVTILPRTTFKAVSAWVFRRLYKVEVRGLEKLAAVEGPVVIVANHVSWLDGPLLNAFIPGDTLFAINSHVFMKWWGGLSRFFANMLPVDPSNPMSTKTMIKAVEAGSRLVIFPEGRLTKTNGLMKVYPGPAVIADKAGATVVPVKLEGVQFCSLSRLKGKMPLRMFPKITIEVRDPVKLDIPADLKGKARRRAAKNGLYDVMSTMMFQTRRTDVTLFQALLDARRVHGGGKGVVEDPTPDYMSRPMSYDRLVFGALMLGGKLAAGTREGERVGVLLPNTVAAVTTFFALQSRGRIPAMLNFSTGLDSMRAACAAAEIGTVVTSRAFAAKAKGMAEVVAALGEKARIVYLEDFRDASTRRLAALMGLPLVGASITAALAAAAVAAWRFKRKPAAADSPAVVLFTSGSEGVPKGVVLSHRNLLSNMAQLAARIDYSAADNLLNALPIFHSFGMTGGMLLPILSGVKTFMYVSPLHYKIVPELAYDTSATIMFATDTFLAGYAKHADEYDMYSVRYVFAGAERVKDETRRLWSDKFGLRILEGYGATETGPVIALNTPMHFRAGTVGRALPGIETRIEPVPGVDAGGRLFVRGPNVMLGYLKVERPGVLEAPADGWYDTGDIVDLAADGFMRIVGRAKRFVKIAGEMVSLTAVEALAAEAWPGAALAAVGVPDAKKGEQVVLFTDADGADRGRLLALAREKGISELMVPRAVERLGAVPLLGTGKTDYVACQKLALALGAAAEPEAAQ
jgi:acyl-[acyl-carrier-protein]-phospholipid O-acyltransferase/long-chain-fatty-acid--[acyl-carrier-protein] ligase